MSENNEFKKMGNLGERLAKMVNDVESFIGELDLGNIAIKEEASKIDEFRVEKRSFGRRVTKELNSLASGLGTSIADYKSNSYQPLMFKIEKAKTCMYYIEVARTHNVVLYPKLALKAQKFDELEKEFEKLKSDHTKLMKSYNELAKENERLEKENKILHSFDKKGRNKDNGFMSGGLEGS